MVEERKAAMLAMIATIDEKIRSARILHEDGYYNDSLSRA